jgi:hypothetical protein
VVDGTEPDCANDEATTCAPVRQNAKTPGIWNPLPDFDTVRNDRELRNIQSVENFYTAAKTGNLPWSHGLSIEPVSEHRSARVSAGQSYVTSLINAVMKSPDWSSTAIFVARDDWVDSMTTRPTTSRRQRLRAARARIRRQRLREGRPRRSSSR